VGRRAAHALIKFHKFPTPNGQVLTPIPNSQFHWVFWDLWSWELWSCGVGTWELFGIANRDEDLALPDHAELLARDAFDSAGIRPQPPHLVAQPGVVALQIVQLTDRFRVGPPRANRFGQSPLAEQAVHEQHAREKEHHVRPELPRLAALITWCRLDACHVACVNVTEHDPKYKCFLVRIARRSANYQKTIKSTSAA